MPRLDFESAADQLHELIRETDAETLAALYEYAFGAVHACYVANDEASLIVEFEGGLEDSI